MALRIGQRDALPRMILGAVIVLSLSVIAARAVVRTVPINSVAPDKEITMSDAVEGIRASGLLPCYGQPGCFIDDGPAGGQFWAVRDVVIPTPSGRQGKNQISVTACFKHADVLRDDATLDRFLEVECTLLEKQPEIAALRVAALQKARWRDDEVHVRSYVPRSEEELAAFDNQPRIDLKHLKGRF